MRDNPLQTNKDYQSYLEKEKCKSKYYANCFKRFSEKNGFSPVKITREDQKKINGIKIDHTCRGTLNNLFR